MKIDFFIILFSLIAIAIIIVLLGLPLYIIRKIMEAKYDSHTTQNRKN